MRKLLLFLALFFLSPVTNAIEEPDYAVMRKWGAVEIRFYASYVVAQVAVPGPEEAAGNQSVPILADYIFGTEEVAGNRAVTILADYIFGKNNVGQQFATVKPIPHMAAPVRLEMTAPVMQTAAVSGFMVQFVLPKRITLDNAPVPDDGRIQLRAVAGGKRAAIAFSGLWSEANYDEHLEKLKSALRAVDLPWTGDPVYARYNPLRTPWFMRRNEIWLTVQ